VQGNVAERGGVIETAREFPERRAGQAKPKDLSTYWGKSGRDQPAESVR
jgi:hypothetical protein